MKPCFALAAPGLALGTLLLLAGGAGADPIPGLFNTGVLDNGTAAADGAVDLHYRLIVSPPPSPPGPDAIVANPIASGYWVGNSPTARWIAPAANQAYPGGGINQGAGDYTYRLTFDLTGFNPATAHVTGNWGGDNLGVRILINGVDIGTSQPGYNPLAAFAVNTGFVAGLNTLDFVVNNYAPTGDNPTGLMVAGLTGTATSTADSDGDGVTNSLDNCTNEPNPGQLDADGDGYGNLCDADLNNSGLVTTTDFNLLRSVLNQSAGAGALAAAADINGSGLVTSTDFTLLRSRLNGVPGPSGLHPNCPPTCP